MESWIPPDTIDVYLLGTWDSRDLKFPSGIVLGLIPSLVEYHLFCAKKKPTTSPVHQCTNNEAFYTSFSIHSGKRSWIAGWNDIPHFFFRKYIDSIRGPHFPATAMLDDPRV